MHLFVTASGNRLVRVRALLPVFRSTHTSSDSHTDYKGSVALLNPDFSFVCTPSSLRFDGVTLVKMS
jgi:hypothetical protein